MENLINIIGDLMGGLSDFYNSTAFTFIKFILGLYTAILFINIILLLFQRGFSGDIKETLLGMNLPRELVVDKHKNQLKLKWEEIKKGLISENESEWKVAVISADNLIDGIMAKMGYAGETMEERLLKIPPGQIENLEDLKKAHEIKKKVVYDESFRLDREKAEEAILCYEEFLKIFDVLD